MVFTQRPRTFATEASKVQYILGLLRGRALAWAEAVSTNTPITTLSLSQFEFMLREVFDHPDHCGDASHHLLELQQGVRSVADYSVEFRVLPDSGWNDAALQGGFQKRA